MKKILIERPKVELKVPTSEEFRGWLEQSVGKYHKAYLVEKMEDIKDNWANGVYLGDTQEETNQKNAEAIGQVQQIAEIILELEESTIDEQSSEDGETDGFTD